MPVFTSEICHVPVKIKRCWYTPQSTSNNGTHYIVTVTIFCCISPYLLSSVWSLTTESMQIIPWVTKCLTLSSPPSSILTRSITTCVLGLTSSGRVTKSHVLTLAGTVAASCNPLCKWASVIASPAGSAMLAMVSSMKGHCCTCFHVQLVFRHQCDSNTGWNVFCTRENPYCWHYIQVL